MALLLGYLASLHYGTHTSKKLGIKVYCGVHCSVSQCHREAEEQAKVKTPAVVDDGRQASVYPHRRHYHRSHVRVTIVSLPTINRIVMF